MALEGRLATSAAGSNYDRSRLEDLKARDIPEAETVLLASEALLDSMMSELAAVAPSQALEHQAYLHLDRVFVGAAAMRNRFASASRPGAFRDRLYKRTFEDFFEQLGANDPATAFNDYFLNDEIYEDAREAAIAFVGMYADKPKDLGRMAARRAQDLAVAATNQMGRPFAQARNPAAFQSAVARYAGIVFWVLRVIEAAPDANSNNLNPLRNMVFDHAENVLCTMPDDEFSGAIVDTLAISVVVHMSNHPDLDRRETWLRREDLTPAARAFAAWSRGPSSPEDLALAEHLFVEAARPRLHTHAQRHGFGRALRMLDLAAATLLTEAPQEICRLDRLWEGVSPAFAEYGHSPHRPNQVIAATKGDADAVEYVKQDAFLGGGFLASVL